MSTTLKRILINIYGSLKSFLYLLIYRAQSRGVRSISILVEEFFHEDLRGFGGFGKTAQNLSSHFNSLEGYSSHVELTHEMPELDLSTIAEYHDTFVLLKPSRRTELNSALHKRLSQSFNSFLNITIDYYPSYSESLLNNPNVPVMVYIRDPRGRQEWSTIGSVPLELKERKRDSLSHLMDYADEKKEAISKVMVQSRADGRPFFFATAGKCLVERASRTYGVDIPDADLLYNAIPLDEWTGHNKSENPTLCFLGRLDSQKRFWMVFELARKFPNVEFRICGKSNNPHLVEPILAKYSDLENIHFEGLVTGRKKQRILSQSWALINTSVHEGYPVSFQEAFAQGTPVISCLNPDDVVKRFGYYTGEIEGEGLDDHSLGLFQSEIESLLDKRDTALEKGMRARRFVEENHSFKAFDRTFEEIIDKRLADHFSG